MESPDPARVLREGRWVRDLAARLLRDGNDADDAAQEAMVDAIGATAAADRAVRPWLGAIVRNRVRKLIRGRERRRMHEAKATPSGSVRSTADLVASVEIQRLVSEEVLALPEPYRTTILLRYFEGASAADIARAHAIPEGTVRWRTARAIEQLRGRLVRRMGDRSSWRSALLVLVPRAAGVLAMKTIVGTAVACLLLILWWSVGREPDVASSSQRAGATSADAIDAGAPHESIDAVAPDRARVGSRVADEDESPVDASVAPLGSVRGRVVDVQRSPIAGAIVEVWTNKFRPSGAYDALDVGSSVVPWPARRTRTADDGTFTFAELPPGFVAMRAYAAVARTGGELDVPVDAGRETTVSDLVVKSQASPTCFDGTVIDVDGAPVPGAVLQLFVVEKGVTTNGYCKADALGGFHFAPLGYRLGGKHLDVLAYDPARTSGWTLVRDVAPSEQPRTIRLDAGAEATLCIRDPRGRPIERFLARLVVLADPAAVRPDITLYALTDESYRAQADGAVRFHLPPLPFRVEVLAPGTTLAPVRFGPFDPAQVGDVLECVLPSPPAVRGRVLAQGRPVPGARVIPTAPAGIRVLGSLCLRAGFPSTNDNAAPSLPVDCDADGRFEIVLAEGSTYRLHAQAPGFGDGETTAFVCDASQREREIEVELTVAGRIAGRVVISAGESRRDRPISASFGDGFIKTARTDAQGRFAFDDCRPGEWLISPRGFARNDSFGLSDMAYRSWIDADALALEHCSVESGRTTEVVVDLGRSRACELHGRLHITGLERRPHHAWLAPANAPPGLRSDPLTYAFVAPDGTFSLGLPKPGRYRLHVEVDGATTRIDDLVELRPGRTEWSLAYATGSLRLEKPGGMGVSYAHRLHVADSTAEIISDIGGDQTIGIAWPCGPAQLSRLRSDGTLDPAFAPLAVCIPPGGEITVDPR